MRRPQTIAEKIFSAHANRPAYAGDSIVARLDAIMATDGSGPMVLGFFRRMGGTCTFDGRKPAAPRVELTMTSRKK